MGLDTMLFGVSGSCDDMDATSLPVEFEPGPPSEKLTCETYDVVRNKNVWHKVFILSSTVRDSICGTSACMFSYEKW